MPITKDKVIDRKRSIGEVAKEIGVETHVIRFWEDKFVQIKPEIGRGKRRYYFSDDIETLKRIKSLLYEQGYTIAGLQKLLRNPSKAENQKEQALNALQGKKITVEGFVEQDLGIKDCKSGSNFDPSLVIVLLSRIESNLNNLEKLFNN